MSTRTLQHAATISLTDLHRIKDLASTGLQRSTNGAARQGTGRLQVSAAERQARKKRMMDIDDRRLKEKATSGKGDEEAQDMLKRKVAPRIAEHDYAKTLRSVVARSKAINSRQAQLREKEEAKALEKEIEARWHAEMMERIAREEAQERAMLAAKREKQMQVAAELQQQLHERALEREVEQERVAQEGEAIRQQIVAQAAAEERKIASKREAEARRLAELAEINTRAQARKQRIADAEREADQERYIEMLRSAERARQEEEAKLAAAKQRELEFAAMLAAQERIADNRGEEDAKKAKAHQEEKELRQRAAIAAKRRAREESNREMLAALERQKAEKAARRAAEEAESTHFLRVAMDAEVQAHQQAVSRQAAADRARDEYRQQLVAQIESNKSRAREARNAVLQERKDLMMMRKAEADAAAEYRDATAAALVAGGVTNTSALRDLHALKLEM
jgi:hypothetical protein